MVIRNLEEFLKVIQNINAFRHVDGILTERNLLGRSSSPNKLRLVVDELLMIDKRLPGLIKAVTRPGLRKTPIDPNDYDVVYTQPIKDTIQFWANPRYIKATNGDLVAYRLLVSIDLHTEAEQSSGITISLWNCELNSFADVDGREVTYVDGSIPQNVNVCPMWLSDIYPEWEVRYANAKTLGYTGSDLVALTLSTVVTASVVDMPDILVD